MFPCSFWFRSCLVKEPSVLEKRLQSDRGVGQCPASGFNRRLLSADFDKADVLRDLPMARPRSAPLAGHHRRGGSRARCPSPKSRLTLVLPFIRKPCDLQCLVVLIRPEPGYGVVGEIRSQHVPGGKSALVLRIPPSFQPYQSIIVDRVREGAAVAGSSRWRRTTSGCRSSPRKSHCPTPAAVRHAASRCKGDNSCQIRRTASGPTSARWYHLTKTGRQPGAVWLEPAPC